MYPESERCIETHTYRRSSLVCACVCMSLSSRAIQCVVFYYCSLNSFQPIRSARISVHFLYFRIVSVRMQLFQRCYGKIDHWEPLGWFPHGFYAQKYATWAHAAPDGSRKKKTRTITNSCSRFSSHCIEPTGRRIGSFFVLWWQCSFQCFCCCVSYNSCADLMTRKQLYAFQTNQCLLAYFNRMSNKLNSVQACKICVPRRYKQKIQKNWKAAPAEIDNQQRSAILYV